ncbi:hypothetical protein EHM69_04850 [candidate division KSB1 bacterium]|nr:MAG: hypothetical protein EHM69_04850 [candidate division KSB1 bacterium]
MNTIARTTFLISIIAALAAMLSSCKKEDNPPTGPNNGDGEIAHIAGTVRDASGNPVPNVSLHVVYEWSSAPDKNERLDQPSITIFHTTEPLMTECGGSEPIPDGIMARLFWDHNSNGPDDSDEPPPLCDEPPRCDGGPIYTVNWIETPFNGEEIMVGRGQFYTDPALVTQGDLLIPNRFYFRVYCADGNVLYTSNVVNPVSSVSEVELTFTCTPCEGAPLFPSWNLEQSFPNPAIDTAYVRFGLQQTGYALVTLRPAGGRDADTLFYKRTHSGMTRTDAILGNKANGLYEVRLNTDLYQAHHTLLRNVRDFDRLRTLSAAALSTTDGSFTLEASAGVSIDRRGTNGDNQGSVFLSRVKVVAMKTGYQAADTTFDVTAGETYNLNLSLRTE